MALLPSDNAAATSFGEESQQPHSCTIGPKPDLLVNNVQVPATVTSTKHKSQSDDCSAVVLDDNRIRDEDASLIPSDMPTPTSITSAKRKLIDQDADPEASARKRIRDEDWQPMEADVNMNAAAITKVKAEVLGPYYKTTRQPHLLSHPHPSQNLISLFGLDDFTAGLARRDPKTGEKINRLRKSYENQIKDLPGKNKPNTGGDFIDMLNFPDDEWQIQRVGSRDVTNGITTDMLANLGSAVRMEPSQLPPAEHNRWKSLLALNEPPAPKPSIPPAQRPDPAQATRAFNGPGVNAMEPPRATRRGTKRRYDDESFEGYGEGFVDDASMNHVIEEPEELISGAKRKKRRDGGATSAQYANFNAAITVGNGPYAR